MKRYFARLLRLALTGVASGALAADKPPQFWNLTSSAVVKLEIAKAGSAVYGPNQTANDPDGSVEHDERLKIAGVSNGTYDLRITLKDGRTCFARDVEIASSKPFSIEERDLVGCKK